MRSIVAFGIAAAVAALPARAQQWSDDFNRPDAPTIGGDWTETTGTWGIKVNRGVHTSTGVNTILTHNSANLPYQDTTAMLDVFRPGGTTANAFVGLLIGLGGADTIMVKIQSQSSNEPFSHIGIYHKTSATGWGPWSGGMLFAALTGQFMEGRVTVTFPDADTLRVDIDTDFNGTPDQTYISGNVSAIAGSLGTGHGIAGWQTAASFDNWSVSGEAACYPDCDENGQLNIDDFICFQLEFALQTPYADCDGNQVHNIDDFICFQLAFALGC